MTRTMANRSKRGHIAAQVAGLRVLDASGRFSRFIDLRDQRGPLTIGRAERCDITIRDDSVSRVHCRIEPIANGDTFAIEDCCSRNGVRIARLGPGDQRQRVSWEALRLGSFVYLGDVVLVPVDARQRVPIIAWRLSEFVRHARAVYGLGTALVRLAGFGRSLVSRIARIDTGRGSVR